MRRDLTIKTGSLAGTSDFRVLAPIKRGFVPALDAVTYKTRVKRVLRTLHVGRSGAHESELARVLSDAVERVGRIHSVGIAILEPEDKVLLTVTFDGAWESYVRAIWQKVSRLLDLIFCNTDGYVLGYESSYETWGAWLKSAQSEAAFLYATPGLTVDDARYLRSHERVNRREDGLAAEQRITRIRIPTAEEIALQSIFGTGGPVGTDPANAGFGEKLHVQEAGRPAFRHGVRSLVGLYRLADVFPPHTNDGVILHRAAHELLPEFAKMVNDPVYDAGTKRALRRFEEAVLWLQDDPRDEPEVRKDLPVELPADPPLQDPANVQGGILHAYPADHGCLLLLHFESPAALAGLLAAAALKVTFANEDLKPGEIASNIAFSPEGLRVAGLSDDDLQKLPEEFVQGMERRAGLLGDLRMNHPRRWRLPALNWHLGIAAPDLAEDDDAPRIDLSAVHAIVQLRIARGSDPAGARAQLMAEMQRILAASPGVKPLSLQWMQRNRNACSNEYEEHFGFLEAGSDPVLSRKEAGAVFKNQVHLGEILCGYPNLADKTAPHSEPGAEISALLHDGSFLVVRKLRQDIEALDHALDEAVTQPGAKGLTRAEILAKMMGRWPAGHANAGEALANVAKANPPSNDFHFELDPNAALCPFHAHIRRANPRVRRPEEGSRPARIMRRGMSYGPTRDPGDPTTLKRERGLVFMAYNASLGEQFEVVQRWLIGGNSSGSYSGQSDPFVGLAEPGRRRYFRFEHQGQTARIALDGSDRLHDEPRPFVRLEWGGYFFAPSKGALKLLQTRAAARTPAVSWCAAAGEKAIADLQLIERQLGADQAKIAWKAALEDPDAAVDFTTASIWAAIRENHGGVLRTPFGVLVADRDLVYDVLTDKDRRLSISAYLPRMERSFGILYLGLDPHRSDGAYERESAVCNDAITKLNLDQAFERAREATRLALTALVDEAKAGAATDGERRWELTLDARELIDPMLADLCEAWFGMQHDVCFRRGGYRWDWKEGEKPYYPGHFLSPSRYIFQPHPGPDVELMGARHGVAVREAMTVFLQNHGATIAAPVTRKVLDNAPGNVDLAFAARTIAGAMMGFIPTVEGNLRRILNEWLREGTLWALRARLEGTKAADFMDACNRLGDAFIPAMQLRAVPELLWRTAVAVHTLGKGQHEVRVNPGDIVVAGAISATQQNLQQGKQDLYAAFGGNRKAPGHPTHACPGADPALAVMLGFFSALVEIQMALHPGPGPLTLSLEGSMPNPYDKLSLKKQQALFIEQAHKFSDKLGANLLKLKAATPVVVAGDSWFFDRWQMFNEERPNLTKSLLNLDYSDQSGNQFAWPGRSLKDMADNDFFEGLRDYVVDRPHIKAILMCGGGIDVAEGSDPSMRRLYQLVRPLQLGQSPLDQAKVDQFIDHELFGYYQTIIGGLPSNVPVFIHAYDDPIPDGSYDVIWNIKQGPWLQDVFKLRGYDLPKNAEHVAMATEAMRLLIKKLNDMVRDKVAPMYPGRVHHVALNGTLAKVYGNPGNYKQCWANELHPNEEGFKELANAFAAKLKEHGIGLAVPAG